MKSFQYMCHVCTHTSPVSWAWRLEGSAVGIFLGVCIHIGTLHVCNRCQRLCEFDDSLVTVTL